MIPGEVLRKIRPIELRVNLIPLLQTSGAPAIFLSLLLLCSCAAQDPVRPILPADVPINQGAGRGDTLLLTLRLESGELLLFLVDTGAPATLVDMSLEGKLGKSLGTRKLWPEVYGINIGHFYAMPKLYLGNTQLITDSRVMAVDLSGVSNERQRMMGSKQKLVGVLGLDCLRHYCIQLDFATNEMRFLDPDHLNGEGLGQAFPLTINHYPFVPGTLVGPKNGRSLIDTGCNFDGVLTPKLFQQWTNHSPGGLLIEARFPNGTFGGQSYTNLSLNGDGGENLLGLSFLARHLVTFNFPKRTMYLKQTSVGPLLPEPKAKEVTQ